MPLASGTRLGSYQIQAPIGTGGMGEVYRATDTRLGREVAVKILPAEMAQDSDRLARFHREARAVAALNHPNVITLYSVEECDGVHFLTMELVEGTSLEGRIPDGGLPIERIVEVAGALSEALAAAHEKGIVHRDLKPANVMVTSDGRVKVLDFGLAKDVRAESSVDATLTSAGHTQAGIVMGTPAYMSPEQVSGRTLDHRTDIFSLGVLLHEMATGHRPFEGSSSAELVSAILRDAPPSVADMRADVPADLARIIRRCMEKDPRHRLQTARDVSNEFRDLARQLSRSGPGSSSTLRAVTKAESGSSRAEEGFWVAVLPFKYKGTEAGLETLADGLTEEIITGLSRFSYLRVIARNSSSRYSSESGDVRAIGKELGARYVLEGSIRQAGTRLRIAVQLVDANTGAHLWAETYDRNFQSEAIFELQDELVPRIVSTVADTHGVVPRSMSESLRAKDPNQLTPYEALLRFIGYLYRVVPEEHAIVRDCLERAVKQAPGYAPAWAMLAIVYREEYNHGFNPLPDPLGRALAAARRALEVSPSDHLAYHALASTLFFQGEFEGFRTATERAIALNPMDGFNFGYLGMLTAYSGDWERGCAMSEKARTLNPHHPGWYWFTPLFDAYQKGDYRAALNISQRVNMPTFWRMNLALAAIYGHLGEQQPARQAVQALLAVRPNFAAVGRQECSKWWQPELVENLMEGLRKAGLGTGDEPRAFISVTTASPLVTISGETRTAEGFWVAVLPFKCTGGNADLAALAEGLTEDIVTGLSRFSYLRVIARSSTLRYATQSVDVRTAGKELGARYVLEGSLRHAGAKLRLAVQVVDTTTGAHLWAENYERTFSPEAVFELQDDRVPRIVSTVADQHGILARSIAAVIRKKGDAQLSPYEAIFRVFGLHERMTAEEHAAVRDLMERAVRDAPDQGDCWAMLATLYSDEDWFGFNVRPDPLRRALEAAQKAVAIAPASALANQALAQSLFIRRELQAFRPIAERTIALNPMDGATVALMGILLACSGDWEHGCAIADSAMRLNPHFPGWYRLAMVFNAYRTKEYRAAIDAAVRIQMPGYFWTSATCAAAYGQLGERQAAQKALQELLTARPNFATPRKELEKWFEPELVEHFIEGLRKAGLETANE